MIGVKRAHPDSSRQEPPAPKRQKIENPLPAETTTKRRKKYRANKSFNVFVQVFDLGNDVRLVQKVYRNTFF